MATIDLYKNECLIYNGSGVLLNNYYDFENIKYYHAQQILIKEDEETKITLNFKNKTCKVTLKPQDHSIYLKMNVIKNELNNESHEIAYNIETETDTNNYIKITFN